MNRWVDVWGHGSVRRQYNNSIKLCNNKGLWAWWGCHGGWVGGGVSYTGTGISTCVVHPAVLAKRHQTEPLESLLAICLLQPSGCQAAASHCWCCIIQREMSPCSLCHLTSTWSGIGFCANLPAACESCMNCVKWCKAAAQDSSRHLCNAYAMLILTGPQLCQ